MTTRQQLENLIVFMDNMSIQEETKAEMPNTDYTRGLRYGYAGAYKLCAQWLTEILADA